MRFEFWAVAVIVCAGLFIFGRWYENRLLFYPERTFSLLPSDLGLRPEEVYITVGERGDKIHGWFFDAGGEATLLYVHGNAGNIADRLPVAAEYLKHDFNVFMFDFRGYGKSEGAPSKQGIVEDSFAAYDFLVKEKSIKPESIVIVGQSLGGAAALKVAVARPCRGILLEGTFYSIKEMAKDVFGILPLWLLASNGLDSGEEVKKLKKPIIFFHGARDDVVPLRHSKLLYEAANEPKKLVVFKTAGHVDMYEADPALYFTTLLQLAGR